MPEARLRRSLLITPGNRPDRMAKALREPADAFVFDLEDAVPPAEKEAARHAVADSLSRLDFGGRERCVRINAAGTAEAERDLSTLPLGLLDSIMVPKVERAEDLRWLDARLHALEGAQGRGSPVELIVSLETPRGVLGGLDIAGASGRATALFFGSGDYCAATQASVTARALHVPRSLIVAAAAAENLQAIDAAFFTAVKDADATREDARLARELGFSGKLVFHPVQVPVANEVFSPSREDVLWAERVVEAHRAALAEGHGTAVVDGTFVAIDIVLVAERIVRRAQAVSAADEAARERALAR